MVHQRIDRTEEKLKQVEQKVLDNKIWIQRASAVIGAAVTIIGLIAAMPSDADAQEAYYGSNDTPQQEVVLQLPSS